MSLSGQSGVVIDQNNIKMNTLQSLQAAAVTGDVGGKNDNNYTKLFTSREN